MRCRKQLRPWTKREIRFAQDITRGTDEALWAGSPNPLSQSTYIPTNCSLINFHRATLPVQIKFQYTSLSYLRQPSALKQQILNITKTTQCYKMKGQHLDLHASFLKERSVKTDLIFACVLPYSRSYNT